MCNPTKSPPEAPSSASPPTSAPIATSLTPLSPASTLSSFGISSSNQNSNQNGNNNNSNSNSNSNASSSNREDNPPMLNFVASSRQFDLERQESRDDRNWKQRQMHRQSPFTSETPSNDDDDYDDGIPSLVEEEQDSHPAPHAYGDAHDDYNAWQRRQQSQSPLPSSQQPQDPDQQPKRRISPRESFLKTKSVRSNQDQNKEQNQPTPKQPQGGTAALPFFVLDYMIEDLVPKHQNAEELADLLNDKETALSPKKAISFSPLRKSKSCGLVGWSNCKKPEYTEKKKRHTDLTRTPTKAQYKTSPSTRTLETMPPLPTTPKSSNRKHSKTLQPGSQSESPIANMPRLDEDGNPESLFVPRNLNESFQECGGEAGDSYPLPKLRPKAAFGSIPQSPPSHDLDTTTTFAKKSASCPQLHRGRDDYWKALQLRKRAQEQHDRRERRNKLTVVQRSLTLAQGWNNKGLIAAGNATRAEQQPSRASNTTTAQEQKHQQQLWESSLECWDNALEIYRSLLGERHERVADVQNNRGIALGKLGFFQDALEALGMALEARKKQEQRARAEPKQGQRRSSRTNNNKTNAASVSAAIVSTLHNIANVFRDAGNPAEALGVLVEAQNTLLAFETPTTSGNALLQHRHYYWHQSARLSTAIGHVYYESESWRDAREAYVEAFEVYEKLSGSLSSLSDRLGWEKQQHGDNPGDAKRAELLHHCQLIEREVASLKKDLDEIDRCQQARVDSRARLLQAHHHQQQQKQKLHEASSHRIVPQQQQQQQQQQQTPQQQPIFGIVSSLRT